MESTYYEFHDGKRLMHLWATLKGGTLADLGKAMQTDTAAYKWGSKADLSTTILKQFCQVVGISMQDFFNPEFCPEGEGVNEKARNLKEEAEAAQRRAWESVLDFIQSHLKESPE